jgi:hypothetical protein
MAIRPFTGLFLVAIHRDETTRQARREFAAEPGTFYNASPDAS